LPCQSARFSWLIYKDEHLIRRKKWGGQRKRKMFSLLEFLWWCWQKQKIERDYKLHTVFFDC
jgi:hypothetical protein